MIALRACVYASSMTMARTLMPWSAKISCITERSGAHSGVPMPPPPGLYGLWLDGLLAEGALQALGSSSDVPKLPSL